MGYKKTCFNCKKSFNRPIDFGTERKYPCPDCGQEMILMSHKFRPPTKSNTQKWRLIEFLAKKGFIFQSIFETPSGGTYIKYPDNLKEAEEFVIKYKEQSINWKDKQNSITINDEINQQEILKHLENYTYVIIDRWEDGYSNEYFYDLVVKLSNCLVSEIRPSQKIIIEHDIDSSYLSVHKEDLIIAIKEYISLRKQVFNDFLTHLVIKDSKYVFRDIIKKLRETDRFNKGIFGNWKYWQHGGDIEFKNRMSDEHVNISMQNRSCIKDWSLIQFLRTKDKFENLMKTISHRTERLSKLMNLLVIEGKLIDEPNEMRNKIITLNQSLEITRHDQRITPAS